jgi:hypothetical protein
MTGMSVHHRKTRWLLGLLGAAAIVAVAAGAWLCRSREPTPNVDRSFPLPPYSKSHYLNTRAEARYIGTNACAECHKAEHQSYLLTAHSRALSDLDPKAEPPDGSFEHRLSGRSYRAYRKGDQFRHEEVVRTEDGKEIARVDLPVRYLIGSGNFARTYLVEVDGFLQESPITWYASKKQYGMSPGYDAAQHWSFDRPVTDGCMVCHAGRAEPVDGAVHRLTFHEKTIGCENCHGPGSLHQAFQRTGKHIPGDDDPTIVRPDKLARSLQEDICAACHFSAQATVHLRGRKVGDFRPGTPLSDYQIHYGFEDGNEQMTVVGHVEQLRMSACYQKSEMTCITCHDPHLRAEPKDKVAFYRQKCLSCHEKHPCSVAPAERLKKDAADNCAACHMPRGDTEIPHIAFTHHRVGRHSAAPPVDSGRTPNVAPRATVGHLSQVDQQRNLGLANLEIYRNVAHAQYGETFRERARQLLESVHEAGLRDGDTAQALAEIYSTTDLPRASAFAQEALTMKDIPPHARAGALMVLAYRDLGDGKFESAASTLEQVVLLRRYADDWRLLGMSYLEQRQPNRALPALQQALAIRPFRPITHAVLAKLYEQLGDGQRVLEHQEKARWLSVHQQD